MEEEKKKRVNYEFRINLHEINDQKDRTDIHGMSTKKKYFFQATGLISTPMDLRLRRIHSIKSVPRPAKLDNIKSPGFVYLVNALTAS